MNVSRPVTSLIVAASMLLAGITSASAGGFALGGLKAAAPQSTIVEVKGKGARNVGLGILGAAAAVAIIAGAANSAKAEKRERGYYDDGPRNKCGFYDRRCEDGERWACRKYRQYCD